MATLVQCSYSESAKSELALQKQTGINKKQCIIMSNLYTQGIRGLLCIIQVFYSTNEKNYMQSVLMVDM